MKLDISRMRRRDDMEGGSWDGIRKREENEGFRLKVKDYDRPV